MAQMILAPSEQQVANDRSNMAPATRGHVQVMVHVQAEVLEPEAARRQVNIWLSMNAGHLLLAENPELLLSEPLLWRFDVLLSVPRLSQPGTVRRRRIGQIRINATTGDVVDPEMLIADLTAHANALARRAA
jgi:hypothetical protein